MVASACLIASISVSMARAFAFRKNVLIFGAPARGDAMRSRRRDAVA